MRYRVLLVTTLLGWVIGANAASIDVLWFTYADPLSEYRTTGIPGIVARAGTLRESSGRAWNPTFFDNQSAVPDFSAYDVLVTASGEAFRTGASGGPLATPDYSAILANKTAIEAARGERTYISGADADLHAIRGDTGLCEPFSGCGYWDGALGYLVNIVNWAASGAGLGIVALLDGEFAALDERWWLDPDSFLHDELNGHDVYFRDNQPVIDGDALTYPLNDGLTSTGLSEWRNSFHAGFVGDIPGYSGTVFSTTTASHCLSRAVGS